MLAQAGVKYVIVGVGINDIAFPGSLTPPADSVSVEEMMSGYRQLIARAHERGSESLGRPIRRSRTPDPLQGCAHGTFYTAEKEAMRQKVNAWMRGRAEFDAVVDLDQVLRDPSQPTRLLPAYDSGDHLHPNDAGCVAEGKRVPLALFEGH